MSRASKILATFRSLVHVRAASRLIGGSNLNFVDEPIKSHELHPLAAQLAHKGGLGIRSSYEQLRFGVSSRARMGWAADGSHRAQCVFPPVIAERIPDPPSSAGHAATRNRNTRCREVFARGWSCPCAVLREARRRSDAASLPRFDPTKTASLPYAIKVAFSITKCKHICNQFVSLAPAASRGQSIRLTERPHRSIVGHGRVNCWPESRESPDFGTKVRKSGNPPRARSKRPIVKKLHLDQLSEADLRTRKMLNVYAAW